MRPTEDDWIHVEDFAAIVGKNTQSVYNSIATIKQRNRWIQLGLPVIGKGPDLPPFYKFDKRVMFRKSEVDEWVMARRFVKAPLPSQQQPAHAAQ